MGSMPLHPAIVHLPLGLAILMPLVATGFAWALWTGRIRPRAWLAVVAFQALLFGSGIVATRTGEAEEGSRRVRHRAKSNTAPGFHKMGGVRFPR